MKFKKFIRAQASAVIATLVDFGSLAIFVEFLHGYYALGVVCGAFMGAITNFTINRYWSFEAAHRSVPVQMSKYFIVFIGSVLLNVVGVWALTEGLNLHYLGSKAVVALLVGLGYNYPLHRFFVFK